MESVVGRTRRLLEAGILLTSELSLDALLQKLVELAAELTSARYAALGVLDPSGAYLERFITTGIDAELRAAIGDLPQGRGILGVLIRDATPLRLHELAADPRSVGFPPNHPPMRTFLGVPLALRGVAYGNLYLTEKENGEDFTAGDEEAVLMLASQAAVAIENARLYEAATRWSSQLESLNEVADALVTEFDLDRLLQLVAERLHGLIGAKAVTIALPFGEGARIAAAAGSLGDEFVGMEIPRRSKTMRVLERQRTERVDSALDDPEIDPQSARAFGMHTGLYVPLVLRGESIGVITARDKLGLDPRFTAEDARLAEAFAQRVSVAVELSRLVARDALQRVVTAQESERRRLARELHDETGQALTSILLGLKTVEEADGEEQRRAAVGELRDLVRSTLQDVRQLAVELRPTALDDFGLVPALERLVSTFGESTGIGVDLQPSLPPERLPPEVETALYRIVQEALTNIVKHARATHVSIVLARRPGSVTAVIEDDGVGFDVASARADGLGLVGMRERVGLLGGRLAIETGEDAGTTLLAEVPLT
ncbi:MAG TPA: GAF domain-containing sensor histidine kinase [Gaiellaceae bacterium]|nr:GAF domain-containing sensor histidine kinase [Gaiellaceae bacterium]